MKKYIILISVFIITLFLIYELNQYTVTKNIFTITTNIQGNCNELKIKAFLNGTFQQYGNSYELETTPFNLLLVLESEKEKNILLREANRMVLENNPDAVTRTQCAGKMLPLDAIRPVPQKRPE